MTPRHPLKESQREGVGGQKFWPRGDFRGFGRCKGGMFNDDFDKKFDRNFSRMTSAVIVVTAMTVIGGLGLVGAVIYVLIRFAGTF